MIDFSEIQGLVPYGKYSMYNITDYMTLERRDISDEDVYDLVCFNRSYNDIYQSNDPTVFVAGKLLGKYHIKPEDLLTALTKLKDQPVDVFMQWFSSLYNNEDSATQVTPNDFKEKYFGDYFYQDDDHLVVGIMNYIDNVVCERNFSSSIQDIITLIIDILNNRKVDINHKNYSDFTLSFVLDSMSYEVGASNFENKVLIDYFQKNLELLVSKNNVSALDTLAYQYYEGTSIYPRNTQEALKLFLKSFELEQSSGVARTLGYIYYYGYHNDHRVPDMDKAFKYFSLSVSIDHNHEATYKLADCFSNGYGVPKCENAAYRLVSKLISPCLKLFKSGEYGGKLADVCLRLASYYHTGTGIQKDEKEALHLILLAKCAIKKRIETMSYIGDKTVALKIESLYKDILKSYSFSRLVEDGGYVVTSEDSIVKSLGDHTGYEISVDVDGIHIDVPKINVDYLYNVAYSDKLCFLEITKQVHLVFKCIYDLSLIDSVSDDDYFIVDIKNNVLTLTKPAEDVRYDIEFDKIIYQPTSLKDIEKRYTVVDVEFETNGKLYEYLCDDESVKVGDSLIVNKSTNPKRVVVVDVNHLYEDQLPLPLNKFNKAYKN